MTGRPNLDRLRVLVVSMYYAPEHSGSAPYTTDMAEALAERGAKVDVVTTWPHYPQWRLPDGVRNRWQTQQSHAVTVHRMPAYIPRHPSLARRVLYETSYVAATVPALTRLRPDVVVGCMPSLLAGCLAASVARARGVGLLQVVQDMITSAAEQSGMSGAQRLAGGMRRAEQYALRSADVISVASPAFIDTMIRLHVDPGRVTVVPNWGRTTPSQVAVDREAIRRDRGWTDRTVVLHTGNMGLKQGLEELAPSVGRLAASDPDVLFVFMGDGSHRETLVEALAGSPNATVLPPVPDEEYLPTLIAADVLLVNERSTVKDMSLPSKLTSYFAAGRPVLAITQRGSATTAELDRAQAGLCIASGDADALQHAIRHLCGPAGERCGQLGAAYAAQELEPEPSLDRLSELVLTAAATHRRGIDAGDCS